MASTILFIHGTGVRKKSLDASMNLLETSVAELLPGWNIEACRWGDAFGAALNKHGASVPSYARTGDPKPSLEAQLRARWVLLADDPLIELRVAPDEAVFGERPGPAIRARIAALRGNAGAQVLLTPAGAEGEWDRFIDILVADVEWQTVVGALTLSEAAASPLVARALVAALQARLRELDLPMLQIAARDALADALLSPLGGPPAGIKESEGKQFELEGAGASKIGPGPVLAVPAGGLKNR